MVQMSSCKHFSVDGLFLIVADIVLTLHFDTDV